ncbi:MAG: hypothetical protein WCE98_02545, partial [Chlorobium sp.]
KKKASEKIKRPTQLITKILNVDKDADNVACTATNCPERPEPEADGAKKPESTLRYIRISSPSRRGNQDAEPFKQRRLVQVPHNLADNTFYKNTIIR